MAEQTIRDRVRVIERAMLQGGLQPNQVREFLSVATALSGWCGREVIEAELGFNAYLAGCKRTAESAAAAKIAAMDSEQFRRLREAQSEQENCTEIIRTLKSMLRSLDSEMRV